LFKTKYKINFICFAYSNYGMRDNLKKATEKSELRLISLFTKSKVNIEKYNFKTFNFDFFGKNKYNFNLKNPIFITSYAIEQLTYLNDDFYISLKKRFNLLPQ
jgi:hypothetical protein